MGKNNSYHKMTRKDANDWSKLYNYVKHDVLGYGASQCLTRKQNLRLKGLSNGKYIDNKNIKNKVNYSYEVILWTFKYSMPDIRNVLNTVQFQDEEHKFNYILKVVQSNIDTVQNKLQEINNKKNNDMQT